MNFTLTADDADAADARGFFSGLIRVDPLHPRSIE